MLESPKYSSALVSRCLIKRVKPLQKVEPFQQGAQCCILQPIKRNNMILTWPIFQIIIITRVDTTYSGKLCNIQGIS